MRGSALWTRDQKPTVENYIGFIDASFTLGLETITLRSEKTPDDVLALF